MPNHDHAYPLVKIGRVAHPTERGEKVEPDKKYRQIGVRLWGNGAYERETINGYATKYQTLFRVEEDDIVVNKIWARNGSVAIVTKELDGCYGSGEFPIFKPDTIQLHPRWFHWITKTKFFWQACDEKSRGTSGQNRINPEKFLQVEIPLPPLDEQRRIVARIEALAGRVAEAQRLRAEAMKEGEAILNSALYQYFVNGSHNWAKQPLSNLITINAPQIDPTDDAYKSLPHINGSTIESNTCRLLHYRSAEVDGMISNKYLFKPGTVLYSKLRPYLRKATFVDFHGICSADMYPIEVLTTELYSRFLMWSLVAQPFTEYANRLSGRTRMPKLNREQLMSFMFAYPDSATQRSIVSQLDTLSDKTFELKKYQTSTQSEIDALLPSILDKAFRGEL